MTGTFLVSFIVLFVVNGASKMHDTTLAVEEASGSAKTVLGDAVDVGVLLESIHDVSRATCNKMASELRILAQDSALLTLRISGKT